MAPPAWAYQVDYFDPSPDEELVCSICQSVFCDPVQSPCNHVFCQNCIVKWLESNRNCPICRKRTTRSSLQEVVPLVKNMIMKLILRCHNRERGCEEQFPLETCESHIKDCAYEMVQCKNRPCTIMLMKRDIQEHEMHNCPHSYTRCSSCNLKISSRKPNTHNCIQELQKKLKEKTIKLKKSNQKIKKLRSELQASKESYYSSGSSFGGSISPSDLLFGIADSEISNISSFESSSSISDSDESDNDFWIYTNVPDEMDQIDSRIAEEMRGYVFEQNLNDSIELPRSSSPVNVNGFNVIEVDAAESVIDDNDDEPEIRRPPKRRLTSRPFDSTDEEENVDSPLPSRKRTLQLFHPPANESVTSVFNLDAAGPSYQSTADSSTSTNDSSPRNFARKTKRSKSRSRAATQFTGSANTAVANERLSPIGSPVFERTISLLEQYNLESDPEWLPSHEHDTIYEMDSGNILERLSEVSSSDIDSDSSYADAAEGKTDDLLNSFYGSSDSDSEWHP